MHQRLVPLSMAPAAGGLRLTAPATTSIAPPGYYMLFLVHSAGVPSVARFVRLSATAPPPGPGPGPGPAAGGAGGSVGGAPGGAPAGLVPSASAILAPLAPRSYWREGFENPIAGIPNAARVGAAYTGRKGLWVGKGAVVPGPALKGGRYRVALRVRNGGVRMRAVVRGGLVDVSLAAAPGRARWRPASAEVRLKNGTVRVRLKVAGGWAIADDLVLRRR